ncbi:hypothetical protein BRADI_5g15730v3 [Brachypodium distachyon]|uniref:RNase H type-1 domain-containing protein n=1 Tax=Brachypodium distachyon TaxID=15368 RepID=A0A2K2CHH0_BRADI|nr:hypothetical protein BRADI_5g15730v3 [Brachypodium distachyon]
MSWSEASEERIGGRQDSCSSGTLARTEVWMTRAAAAAARAGDRGKVSRWFSFHAGAITERGRRTDVRIVKTTSWDVGKLEQFFLPMNVEVIRSIPLSTRRQDDVWAWHFEKNGVFMVRSAYRLTRQPAPRWLPPPAGCTKINVDAAVAKATNMGAVAAVARDEAGVYQGASTVTYPGITDPATLKAMACHEALALAADLGVRCLMVGSDFLEVVKAIHGRNLGPFAHVIIYKVWRSITIMRPTF